MLNIGLKRLFVTIFSTFIFMFVVIYLIRLLNGNHKFVGFSDFYYYLEKVDFWKSFREMWDSFSKLINAFYQVTLDFGRSSDIFDIIANIPRWFGGLFSLISLPVISLYYVLKWIVESLQIVFGFFGFFTGLTF